MSIIPVNNNSPLSEFTRCNINVAMEMDSVAMEMDTVAEQLENAHVHDVYSRTAHLFEDSSLGLYSLLF